MKTGYVFASLMIILYALVSWLAPTIDAHATIPKGWEFVMGPPCETCHQNITEIHKN